ncbi:MAG: ATP-binding cassette domain-containing protein [Oscillospiraceae bacterium]|nr:ATP-binding cassette domain-containing protein [Oscillospiraceae bacterium]
MSRYRIDPERVKKILYGTLRGSHEDLITNRENKFAYAFLRLTEMMTGSVIPIDEAHLENSSDRLEYLKNAENVYAGRFELEYHWYTKEIGPFIGFYGEERTPVILQFRHGRYHMLSLEDETEQMVDHKLAEEIAKDAVVIIPKAGDDIKSGKQLLKMASRLTAREHGILLLFMLAATGVSAGIPTAAGYITGTLVPIGEMTGIFVMAISLIFAILASLFINISINRIKLRIQCRIDHYVLSVIMGRIMSMNNADEKKLSDRIIALIMPFITAVETILGSAVGGIVFLVQSIMIVAVTSSAVNYHNDILMFLVFADIVFVALSQRTAYKVTKKERVSDAKLSALRREILDNIEAIKTGGIEDRIFYRFAVEYDEKMRLCHSVEKIKQTLSILGTLLSGVGVFIIFSHIAGTGEADSAKMSSLVTSFTLMINYLNGMATSFSEIAAAYPHLKFADVIFSAESELTETGSADHVISGKIELDNVTFAYSEDTNPIIRSIDLTIEPGEYVAIVGGSGCGKSTLMRMMLGFLSPTDGYISYDGIDIGQYNMKSLRRQFGVVLQDAAVLTGSIFKNIGLSDDADPELVREAAEAAAVLDDIEAMPMKFNTLLSGEAEVISGGQRQRIVLARALMNKPKILFLDEATSAVDNISQKKIKDNLDKLGVTRIVIAHRLSTIVNCDRILVMDQGEIAEQGTYSELMEKDGLFAKMAKRSLL